MIEVIKQIPSIFNMDIEIYLNGPPKTIIRALSDRPIN